MTRTLLLGVAVLMAGVAGQAADDPKAVVERAVKAAGRDKEGSNVHHSWTDKGKFTALGVVVQFAGFRKRSPRASTRGLFRHSTPA